MDARPFSLVLAGGGARGYAHAGVLRALEHMGLQPAGLVGGHAHLRVDAADLVLRPDFGGFIDVLDFGARRDCLAAGVRAVRMNRAELESVLLDGWQATA